MVVVDSNHDEQNLPIDYVSIYFLSVAVGEDAPLLEEVQLRRLFGEDPLGIQDAVWTRW